MYVSVSVKCWLICWSYRNIYGGFICMGKVITTWRINILHFNIGFINTKLSTPVPWSSGERVWLLSRFTGRCGFESDNGRSRPMPDQSLKIIGEILESAAFWCRASPSLNGDGGGDVTRRPEMTNCVLSMTSLSGMNQWRAIVFNTGLAGPGWNQGYSADRKVPNWHNPQGSP